MGLWAATGKFEASLSDGSAPAYLDTSLSSTSSMLNRVYTVTYGAASPGQTLTVRWTIGQSFNTYGNVTLQAAAVDRAREVDPLHRIG